MADLITQIFFLFFNLRKNDGRGILPVWVVSNELVQPHQYSISPDLLYLLFDNVSLKIFCLEIEFFCEIEHMSSTRYEMAKVPKDGRS